MSIIKNENFQTNSLMFVKKGILTQKVYYKINVMAPRVLQISVWPQVYYKISVMAPRVLQNKCHGPKCTTNKCYGP